MSPKKIGRPKSKNPKEYSIRIRATKEDRKLLEECCEKTGKTHYEIVMDGINRIYKEIIG